MQSNQFFFNFFYRNRNQKQVISTKKIFFTYTKSNVKDILKIK